MLLDSEPLLRRLNKRRLLIATSVLASACLLTVVVMGQLRWRAEVVLLHMTGQIPDIELKQILAYMMPGSDQSIEFLLERRTPYAVIRNFKTSPADIQNGGQLFRSQCAMCHAQDGSGGPGGPALSGRKLKNGDSDWAIYRTIRLGVGGTEMRPHALTDTELWQLVGFIHSLDISGNREDSRTAARKTSSRSVFLMKRFPFANLQRTG